ncbi:MAG TPA: GNAT family N-acetyltransferase [Solirubrobacterales bacterium]
MRDELLEFELRLGHRANEEVVEYAWGKAFLSPTLPFAWDANWVLIERAGISASEAIAAADEALAAYEHRALAIKGEAEGERLAPEIAAIPGWEAEKNLFMIWRGEEEPGTCEDVRETPLAGCEDLRRQLIDGEFPPEMPNRKETVAQLLEMNRRCGKVAGDRWFVSPAGQPASACCLLADGEIGQVEDVGTLPSARGQGLAKAVIRAALAASREAGHRLTFIVADAEDWPRLLYEKLGFAPCGVLHVLRRMPPAGIST